MSTNIGKDGEMALVKVVADMAIAEERVDFTRTTTTNTADMGADLFISHPKGFMDKIEAIAAGNPVIESNAPSLAKTRVDKKTTEQKLTPVTVGKFIGDVHKHPDCEGHALVGGSGLNKPAQRMFDAAKSDLARNGKNLVYINNEGLTRIGQHYSRQLQSSEES
ncbi:hypothetical protein [Achromobacter kerstersii]